jgi:hypothetical protein
MPLPTSAAVRPLAFFLLALVPLAAGCSPAPSGTARESTDQARAAIQGGELAPAASLDFAVALVGGGLCSGTLIAPNLAVTARHCVEEDPERTPPCAGGALLPAGALRVVIGREAAPGAPNFVVSKIIPAPETNGCVPDLALVQLAKLVPASVAKPARPAIDAAFRARPHYLPTVTAIGFGVDDVGEAGVRRLRRDIPVLCVRGDTQFDCGVEANNIFQPFEIITGPGSCQGDSGGGLYEPKGAEANDAVLLSVVSRGPIDADGTCQEGIHVRVDPFHNLFVTSAVAAAAEGNYPLPVWAGGKDVPVPVVPPSPTPPVDETPAPAGPAPIAEPTTTTTTTTTTSCAAAPGRARRAPVDAGIGLLAVALALALAARRRARRTPAA